MRTSLRAPDAPIIAALILGALVFVVVGATRIAYPYDGGDFEANAWAPASLVAHLHDPYAAGAATHAPFVAAPYGPFYYAVVGIGLRLFGNQFWFMRTLLVVATLVSAWLAFRIVVRFTASRGAGLICAVLLLGQYPVLFYAGVQRADLLALMFVLLGLDLGLRDRAALGQGAHPLGAGLAVVAAVLSRQTDLLPIAAIWVWYAAGRDYRALGVFTAAVLVAGAGIVAALSIVSHGGFITETISNQSGAATSTSQLVAELRSLLDEPVCDLTALLLLIGAVQILRRRRTAGGPEPSPAGHDHNAPPRLVWVLSGYLVLSFVVAAVAASRVESGVNYFIEPLAIASILAGLAAATRPLTQSRNRALLVAAVLMLSVVITAVRGVAGDEVARWHARHYFAQVVTQLRAIPASRGPMFSEYPELVSDAGRTAFVNDFVQYDGRAPSLQRALHRLIASRRLSAIIEVEAPAPRGYVAEPIAAPTPSGVAAVHIYVRRGSGR